MRSLIITLLLAISANYLKAQPNWNQKNGFYFPLHVFVHDNSRPAFETGIEYENWMNDKFSISGAILMGPQYFRVSPGIWGYAMLNSDWSHLMLIEKIGLFSASVFMLQFTEAVYYNINLSGLFKNTYLSPYISGRRLEFITDTKPWKDWIPIGGAGLKYRCYIKKKFQIAVFGEMNYHPTIPNFVPVVGMTAGWSFR